MANGRQKRVVLIRLDFETGGIDTKTNKRLPSIPVGIFNKKGTKPILSGKRSVSLPEYKKAREKFSR